MGSISCSAIVTRAVFVKISPASNAASAAVPVPSIIAVTEHPAAIVGTPHSTVLPLSLVKLIAAIQHHTGEEVTLTTLLYDQ